MNDAQIHGIVSAAMTAPSGDNCQPWTFHWDGQSLTIRHQNDRARHVLNRHNHASLLSLGCVLELIRIAASHEKMEADVALGSLDAAQNASWAVLRFRESAIMPDPLR